MLADISLLVPTSNMSVGRTMLKIMAMDSKDSSKPFSLTNSLYSFLIMTLNCCLFMAIYPNNSKVYFFDGFPYFIDIMNVISFLN